MIANCIVCKKEFKTKPCYLKTGRGKHCSKKCAAITKSKYPIWNKGTEGIMKKNSGSFTIERLTGKANNMWKGNLVGYSALHDWIYRRKGKPKRCIHCGSMNKVQWANKSHNYNRDVNDWIELCYWCHRKYDMKNGWGKIKIRFIKNI